MNISEYLAEHKGDRCTRPAEGYEEEQETIHEFYYNGKTFLIEEDEDGYFSLVDDDDYFSSLDAIKNHIELIEDEQVLFDKCLELGVIFYRDKWEKITKIENFFSHGKYLYFLFAYIPTLQAGRALEDFLYNESILYNDLELRKVAELIPSNKYHWDDMYFPCVLTDTHTEDYKYNLITSQDLWMLKSIIVDRIFD